MFENIWRKVTIILVYHWLVEGKDLLHLFRPKPDLPQELNDFLTDVQEHKKDFAFIRNVAKNRRKYEKSFAENHDLFVEDLDNQLTIAPYYNRRFNSLDNQNPQIEEVKSYDSVELSPSFVEENSLKSYYPNERYSKFIHSPIRLQRGFERNYLDTHVQVEPNGRHGEIRRPEPKFPRSRLDEEEDDDNNDDYSELIRPDKRKREVEISIKSDGKLVRQIEESENGPKSIVLNIKENNPNINSQSAENSISNINNTASLSSISGQPVQEKRKIDSPSNSNTIPSLANAMPNQNWVQNKNIGVPINSLATGNNAASNNKNTESFDNHQYEPRNSIMSNNDKESSKDLSNQNYGIPEVSKVSNINQKFDFHDRGVSKNGNSGWSGNNDQFPQSADLVKNNGDNLGNMMDKANMNQEEKNRESDFEKVQGLVVDKGSTNENTNRNQVKYINRRRSVKEKRWNDIGEDINKLGLPLDAPEDGTQVTDGGFDYEKSLEQEVNDLSNPELDQQYPKSIQLENGDHEIINLSPNQTYEILEHSTKNILILPVQETTTECVVDLHIPQKGNLSEEKQEEAKIIGEAIAQVIEHETETTEREEEETTTGCEHENETVKQKDTKIEIITHEKENEEEQQPNDQHNENIRKIEIVRKGPENGHNHHHDSGKVHGEKRQSERGRKKGMYELYDREGYRPSEFQNKRIKKFKREKDFDTSDREGLRNRKHLPTLPKYKRKRVRQHPKKRIERQDVSSLTDYYDFGKSYDEPADTFDFIPSYYRRQLKSVNYDYDPYLISDVGHHERDEMKSFEESHKGNKLISHLGLGKVHGLEISQNAQGIRKKFKSEGDYSDEEDTSFKFSPQKLLVRKTENELAPNTKATTEDNDDDYNYQDLSDDEDDDEDVAYEEVSAKNIDNLEVEEPVSNFNKSDEENDKLYLSNHGFDSFKAAFTTQSQLVFSRSVFSLKNADVKETLQKTISADPIINRDIIRKEETNAIEQSDNDANREDDMVNTHGHALGKKKAKKKIKPKPKRNYETNIEHEADGISNFHGRGHQGFKSAKHKQTKYRRNDGEVKKEGLNTEKESRSFDIKPLSNKQKQDIFLRYNPDFQRWPRFVQNDNKYRELMRERSLENRERSLRNAYNNRFPISNEYFLNPKRPDFVKREEPSTQETTSIATSTSNTEVSKIGMGGTTEHNDPSSDRPSNGQVEAASLNAQESLNEATLPQAAKNILQTANSDIFENTTVPSLEVAGIGNNSLMATDNIKNDERPTSFQFTTNADDLTENTQCLNTQQKDFLTPCPDENAAHSPVNITSVLPLVPDSVTSIMMNISKDEYLDLNEIVGGSLPKLVVSQSLSNARGGIRLGLNSGKFNINLPLSTINSSAETRMILDEMTNLMLKLKYHSTCQILPPNLKTYIKLITKNEMDDPMAKIKEMQEIDFDEHQSSYVFHSGDTDSIQSKAQILKELLVKYNNLPQDCKERAEPVKEYIESHLAMIDNMSGKGISVQNSRTTSASESFTSAHTKSKKEADMYGSDNHQQKDLDNQMIEEGLNNQKADANEAIDDKNRKDKREAEDSRFALGFGKEISTSTSPQYGKLAEAVRKMRHRRESVRRISEIYGRAQHEDNEERYKEEDKHFESPLVIKF